MRTQSHGKPAKGAFRKLSDRMSAVVVLRHEPCQHPFARVGHMLLSLLRVQGLRPIRRVRAIVTSRSGAAAARAAPICDSDLRKPRRRAACRFSRNAVIRQSGGRVCSAAAKPARSRRPRNPARQSREDRETQNPIKQKPASKGGPAIPAGAGKISVWQSRDFPTSPILASPFGVHRQSAPKNSRFRAGCAATPEAPLRSISAILPALPGFSVPQPRAPWPVWRNSVAGEVRFAPISRKAAAKLWHAARRWDRDTHEPGRHGGVIGRTALAALYALLFDYLNHRTGRLDPSLDAIARKAGCCRRAVVDAIGVT